MEQKIDTGILIVVTNINNEILLPVHIEGKEVRFIADMNNPECIDWMFLIARMWSLERLDIRNEDVYKHIIKNKDNLILSKDYWTCECEENFVHHNKDIFCPKCFKTWVDSPVKHRTIESVLGWKIK